MWTKLMVRLYAIRYVKAYRHRVIKLVAILIAAFALGYEITAAIVGELSGEGAFVCIISITLLTYFMLRYLRGDVDEEV